jgi:hypothetical protein
LSAAGRTEALRLGSDLHTGLKRQMSQWAAEGDRRIAKIEAGVVIDRPAEPVWAYAKDIRK